MKIGLVACASKKLNKSATAGELYMKSALFRYALAYCKKHYEKTYVLSAKHGLLELETTIEPYNTTLNVMPAAELQVWGKMVADQIKKVIPTGSELFFHAGAKYRTVIRYLKGNGVTYTINEPMKAVGGIGKQLKFYKDLAGGKIAAPK